MIEFSETVFVDVVVELGEAPILSGVENLTIPYGEPFDPLKGVTAYDADDGNLTDKIKAEDRILEKGATVDLLEGVIAYDAKDGDLTSKIEVIHNTVDINQVGIYEVTYQVSDKQGATTTLTIKIEVREIPQTGLSLFN